MEIFLLIVHVIVCAVLILVILMQPGRSGGLSGGAFGGMGGGGTSMFGGGGAVPMLAKVTTYVGIIFALTCIGLWYAGRSPDSVPSTAAERLMEEGQMPMQQIPQPLTFPETTPTEGTTQTAPADTGSTTP
ncbi:MAG: preprotein translocase subunit SecG [Gemmatimonadetes bacterium]|nr:preprotein translocase subunit SecG [Gemmatimonadota bacterium]MXX14588.1 preprotein translocase subunit SecG [Gemmatimonadota bacterium]MXZ07822.1 preprotein translocase subunit SecG [Gemmatimonadota bacterium]MYB58603.1 preprotein translocase subunit SecG [Gemmatimonadota bacterium]MYD61000.1 preprotein translocase subunit SecG [Gemmatimonadota bacterium]